MFGLRAGRMARNVGTAGANGREGECMHQIRHAGATRETLILLHARRGRSATCCAGMRAAEARRERSRRPVGKGTDELDEVQVAGGKVAGSNWINPNAIISGDVPEMSLPVIYSARSRLASGIMVLPRLHSGEFIRSTWLALMRLLRGAQ